MTRARVMTFGIEQPAEFSVDSDVTTSGVSAAASATSSTTTPWPPHFVMKGATPVARWAYFYDNNRRQSSGHIYFSLKDQEAQLPCAMWRTYAQRLRAAGVPGRGEYLKVNAPSKPTRSISSSVPETT